MALARRNRVAMLEPAMKIPGSEEIRAKIRPFMGAYHLKDLPEGFTLQRVVVFFSRLSWHGDPRLENHMCWISTNKNDWDLTSNLAIPKQFDLANPAENHSWRALFQGGMKAEIGKLLGTCSKSPENISTLQKNSAILSFQLPSWSHQQCL